MEFVCFCYHRTGRLEEDVEVMQCVALRVSVVFALLMHLHFELHTAKWV
jgi:hypothetical protein